MPPSNLTMSKVVDEISALLKTDAINVRLNYTQMGGYVCDITVGAYHGTGTGATSSEALEEARDWLLSKMATKWGNKQAKEIYNKGKGNGEHT